MTTHIAVMWQRFLPYHIARLRKLGERCADAGFRLSALEVASRDAAYGFSAAADDTSMLRLCCFPGESYHDKTVEEVRTSVLAMLRHLGPDIVFAPATPFPEGMAAVMYRSESGCRTIMMDDAWEHTDRTGMPTRMIKRLIHRNIDGAFLPAESHLPYFSSLGFPADRCVFGVDVVDNDSFAEHAGAARRDRETLRDRYGLPERYFLYVGRFLPGKGLESLVSAYRDYQSTAGNSASGLVLVWSGPHEAALRKVAGDCTSITFLGPKYHEELCHVYGLAECIIVPSERETWGLVLNEAMAAGLPVLASSGCGAAQTLVREGENGWTFAPGDTQRLTELMILLNDLDPEARLSMGKKSADIIAEWSLDRFCDGVVSALAITRRPPAGLLAAVVTSLWKGRITVT